MPLSMRTNPITGFHVETTKDVIADVVAFKDDLRAIGVGNDSDRLSVAIKFATDLEAAVDSGTVRQFFQSADQIQAAYLLSELQDFRQIYAGFRGQLETVSGKLRKALGGSLDFREETLGTNIAR